LGEGESRRLLRSNRKGKNWGPRAGKEKRQKTAPRSFQNKEKASTSLAGSLSPVGEKPCSRNLGEGARARLRRRARLTNA